jgi:hypothetical protein
MIRLAPLSLALTCALAACSAPDRVEVPPARGILHADDAPPAGAQVYERPQWQVGDRFVYRSGGRLRVDFRVAEMGPERIVLEEASGLRQIYTAELAAVGEEVPGEKPTVRETPDPQFLFPLWVGKRWTLELMLAEMRIQVDYHCDVMETVRTPAGELNCLRIWRRARLADSENPFERVTLLWYAPEVGFWAQKLEDGALLVLEEAHRQDVK